LAFLNYLVSSRIERQIGVRVEDRHEEEQAPPGENAATASRAKPGTVFLLILLLGIELSIFSGAFRKFFTHDSLFYMTHIAHSWEEFRPFLLAPSTEMSYRPANLGLVSLLSPVLGVDPHPWHWVPIIFHLANTLLLYLLARRILASTTAAIAASAFWGLHSVAGWITYDITYLSDFLLGFLLLLSLVLAVEGSLRRSRFLTAASLAAFALSLMTKEAATTFPLAIWIALGLANLRATGERATWQRIRASFMRAVPVLSLFLVIDFLFVGLFGYWLATGRIYAQGAQAAYHIDPFSNLLGKAKYLFWALNLPDALSIRHAEGNRTLALVSMGSVLLLWGLDLLRRRVRLTAVEWAGILWFAGLSVPAFLLSQRLAKWYLYLPLLGLALAFGVFAENLRSIAPAQYRRPAGLMILALLIGPVWFSSRVQTMSYIAASNSSYQSDLLQACLTDFQKAHPSLPPQATLFFLPAFEEGVSDLLSLDPIGRGQLFQLYYPNTRIQALHAHKGEPLPASTGSGNDIIVLQYLDRRLYDVTDYFRGTGRMALYLTPTFEGKAAPLLRKVPAGGRQLHRNYVQMLIADDGAQLPDDYAARRDIWILQYMDGRFTDITSYYKGRRRDGARRVIQSLEGITTTVDRKEFYPNYERFGTPTGAPVFFPIPGTEILSQIGASTAVIPLQKIPAGARLQFDIALMFEQGDGLWAEAALRIRGKDTVLYREHLQTDPWRRSLPWKEISIDLRQFENEEADLVLRCYNDPGRNTIADWLNWRDMTLAIPGK
jgi:hypothetical protein